MRRDPLRLAPAFARGARPLLAALVLVAVSAGSAVPCRADDAENARQLVASAKALEKEGLARLDGTGDPDDLDRVREGLDLLGKARAVYEKALADPATPKDAAATAKASLATVVAKLEWWAAIFDPGAGAKAKAKRPDARLSDPAKGEPLARWCEKAGAAYAAEADPRGRAAIAVKVATKAREQGLPTLFGWFRKEGAADARDGLVEAVTWVGGLDVAKEMGAYAKEPAGRARDDALAVIYACLEKAERVEPERPFCDAVRRFHERKDPALSRRIVQRLDAMGWQGTAALGEALYVDDFGVEDDVYAALSRKRDARAVPPLVFRLDRFTFEYQEQMPAHKALLAIGWFAVPELVDRLNDPAAGIWISWTLRKITGRHAGTDRKKWSEWWKVEGPRHPEIEEANREPRPAVAEGPR